jgi:hypothetical protein
VRGPTLFSQAQSVLVPTVVPVSVQVCDVPASLVAKRAGLDVLILLRRILPVELGCGVRVELPLKK